MSIDQVEDEKQIENKKISFHANSTILTCSDPLGSLKELLRKKIEKSIDICSMLRSQKMRYNSLSEKNSFMKLEEEKMKSKMEEIKGKLKIFGGIRRKNRVYSIIFLSDSIQLQEENNSLILKSKFDKKTFEIYNYKIASQTIGNKEKFEELEKNFYSNFNEFLFSLNCSKILIHHLERIGVSNLNVNLFDEKKIVIFKILSRRAEIEIKYSRNNWLKGFDFDYEIIQFFDPWENREQLRSEILEIYKEEMEKIGILKISKFCNKILYLI